MRLQLGVIKLQSLQEMVIAEVSVLIEEHQNAHLVSTDGHLITFICSGAYFCSHIGLTQIEFPIELSAGEF